MTFKEYKKRALNNPAFRKEFERYDLFFEIAQMILEARIRKGWTQEELAKKVGTKQPAIARLESAGTLPTLRFLKRISEAMGFTLKISFQ